MYCPNCGKENENDNLFCAECGFSLKQENDEMVEIEEKFTKKKKNKFDKKVLIGFGIIAAAIAVVILVCSLVLKVISSSNNGMKASFYAVTDVDDDISYILNKGKIVGKIDGNSVNTFGVTKTGNAVLCETWDDEGNLDGLYLVTENEVKCIVDDAFSGAWLSFNGKYVAYLTTDKELYYYDVEKESVTLIDDDMYTASGTFSPDGEYFLYNVYDDDDYILKLYKKGNESSKIATGYSAIAVSDNADCIYAYSSSNDEIVAFNREGERINKYGCSSSEWYIDLTKKDTILFYDDGNSYIVEKDGDKKKIASYRIKPILFYDNYCKNYGLYTLSNTMYLGYDEDDCTLMYLNSKLENNIKVSNASFEDSSDYKTCLYDKNGNLYIKNFADDSESIKIANDYIDAVIASDNETVYYIDEDNTLYKYKNTKSDKLADDVDGLCISEKDIVFFKSDGALYCMKGSEKKKICDDVYTIFIDDLGGVYYSVGDYDSYDLYYMYGYGDSTKILGDISSYDYGTY